MFAFLLFPPLLLARILQDTFVSVKSPFGVEIPNMKYLDFTTRRALSNPSKPPSPHSSPSTIDSCRYTVESILSCSYSGVFHHPII
jgi:hypothetical protein